MLKNRLNFSFFYIRKYLLEILSESLKTSYEKGLQHVEVRIVADIISTELIFFFKRINYFPAWCRKRHRPKAQSHNPCLGGRLPFRFLPRTYWRKHTNFKLNLTFIYSPKHLLDLYRRSKADLALTPLLMKKWSLSNVLSMIVLGMSYRIEAIFKSQFLHIYWVASGMLDYCRDWIVTYCSFYPWRWGNDSFLILSNTKIPNLSMISMA